MKYVSMPSQATLERASQDVYDVIASQQGDHVDSRRRDAFNRFSEYSKHFVRPVVEPVA